MAEIGILISTLIIVIVTFVILRVAGIPLYLHPLGKESLRLRHDDSIIPPINEAKDWRFRMIDEAERKGQKVLLAKVGEFGIGMLDTVKYALDKGFRVTVVGNKTYCNSKEEVINLMKDEKLKGRFKYYVLDYRPRDHFAIIGQSNLFIEDPHDWDAKIKNSLGIANAHKHIANKFNKKFENAIKKAKEADIDCINAMPCYLNKVNT